MKPLAHSADPARSIPAQDYAAHIKGVSDRAMGNAENVLPYCSKAGELLFAVSKLAAEYHDLGKLDEKNQKVLAGYVKSRSLPIQHTDAGTAKLLRDATQAAELAAVLVRSHHIGLPDFIEEKLRREACFRDEKIKSLIDHKLNEYIDCHQTVVSSINQELPQGIKLDKPGIFLRIALSCLVDADHTNTAIHYGGYDEYEKLIPLRAQERLEALKRYVASLGNKDSGRNDLRRVMFELCSQEDVKYAINACDSPVGTGKTTAIMAHLLNAAIHKKLRRIFIVLPYINILTQAVEVYRKALIIEGENPEDVVVAHHHKADFQDLHVRQLTTLWKAPIVVTTAVQFFETMAGNEPSVLRKLHNVPGSGIFIDEAHAALPAKLWPQAWQWLKEYAFDWTCHVVLASGSLARFWEMEEFDKQKPMIPELLPETVRRSLIVAENKRVLFKRKKNVLDIDSFCDWINGLAGPRMCIVNTVQSAAVLADYFAAQYGRNKVEHISTALKAKDRGAVLKKVRMRLTDPNDKDWVLIGTSCIEAGIDVSFRTGIREASSYVSVLQIAGRVNRNQEYENADVWVVELKNGDLLKAHPAFKDSAKILLEMMNVEGISPVCCTDALLREIRGVGGFREVINKAEEALQFPEVNKLFKVIDADTRTVLVDKNIIERLKRYEKMDWQDIQDGSVQMWAYRISDLKLQEMERYPGLFEWNYAYNDFIGYMAGILPLIKMSEFNGAII
ncbi:MAG: CRISPR-associated endonuclease Cas3'' [Candidatus Omnitrophica bacterium]|nr:CRISPR-associated endonuclease Cas3'' [Candidatus Omnitrophota bacterium]MBU4478461.1 CRISPR-associated endonuclease Cas3'' [Candidatus Omnitrophota bacterium]